MVHSFFYFFLNEKNKKLIFKMQAVHIFPTQVKLLLNVNPFFQYVQLHDTQFITQNECAEE